MLFIGWLICPPAHGAEPFEAQGITVIDGDTIHVEVLHLGFGVALTNETIRAADFDAWEASKRRRSVKVTDEEVIKGKAASKDLHAWLNHGKFEIQPVGPTRDRYGRLLGKWYINGVSVAELMNEHGHVREAFSSARQA